MLLSKLWILFLLIAIINAAQAIKNNMIMKRKDTVVIEGEVIDNKLNASGAGMNTYLPVYKYIMDGVQGTVTGGAATMAPTPIGTKTKLYYSSKKQVFIDPMTTIASWTMAIIFALIAVCVMTLSK